MSTILCILTIKYELSNTLRHICFEKNAKELVKTIIKGFHFENELFVYQTDPTLILHYVCRKKYTINICQFTCVLLRKNKGNSLHLLLIFMYYMNTCDIYSLMCYLS